MSTFSIRLIRSYLYSNWTHCGSSIKLSTGIKLDPKHWDAENQHIRKNHPSRQILQARLDKETKRFFDTILTHLEQGIKPTSENVKPGFICSDSPRNLGLSDAFFRYIEMKAPKLAKGSVNNMFYALRTLQEFESIQGSVLSSESFTTHVFEAWLNFQLSEKGYKDQTIQKHVKKLREFLIWAYPERDFRFVRYRAKQGGDPIFLFEEELLALMEAKVHGYLDKTRDLFVFCCLTGMRYSDCQRFKTEWIRDGLIYFRMKKTGGRAIVPLRGSIETLLQKWEGSVPKISSQKYNDYLKALFKRLNMDRFVSITIVKGGRMAEEHKPIHEVVSSHMARRTFITISLMKGIPVPDVMKMSGHSDYDSMKPYIAITTQHLKEIAKRWDI